MLGQLAVALRQAQGQHARKKAGEHLLQDAGNIYCDDSGWQLERVMQVRPNCNFLPSCLDLKLLSKTGELAGLYAGSINCRPKHEFWRKKAVKTGGEDGGLCKPLRCERNYSWLTR